MYVHKGTVTRIGFKTVEGKKGPKKVRIAKSTGEVID
jgi:large subunit ribosomal protein L24